MSSARGTNATDTKMYPAAVIKLICRDMSDMLVVSATVAASDMMERMEVIRRSHQSRARCMNRAVSMRSGCFAPADFTSCAATVEWKDDADGYRRKWDLP
jgi:hypothetical protein